MRDFLPSEKARREQLLGVIRESYRRHGFEEIETPVMEDSARLHSGLGGDNEKLGFAVLKRGLTSDDLAAAASLGDPLALADLGLRFDLTVPLARFYASHRSELPPVFRSIQIAPVWRAERPQKGRYRQFVQCDIDIIGESGQLAELELIAATAEVLERLGLGGARVRINDRRILSALLANWGVDDEHSERVLIALDKLDKLGASGVAAELAELNLAPAFVDQAAVAASLQQLAAIGWVSAEALPAGLDPDAYRDLLALRAALPDVPLDFDPMLVRGMGYYTGTIFEIAHPDFGYSLGGGGRYDGMIGRFLGSDVPACGFSIGFERIVDVATLAAEQATKSVVLHEAEHEPAALLQLKRSLTAAGHQVRLEKRAKNQRAQFERLAGEGFSRVALANPDAEASSLEFRPLD